MLNRLNSQPSFQIRKKEDKYGHYIYYELFRSYHKELNRPENRCDETGEGNTTIRKCIEKFIDLELGCHIPWHTSEPGEGEEDCSDQEQFLNYERLSNKLSTLDAKSMAEETGCWKRCERMEYRLRLTTPLGEKTKYPPEKLKLSFIISSGEG